MIMTVWWSGSLKAEDGRETLCAQKKAKCRIPEWKVSGMPRRGLTRRVKWQMLNPQRLQVWGIANRNSNKKGGWDPRCAWGLVLI